MGANFGKLIGDSLIEGDCLIEGHLIEVDRINTVDVI